MTEPTEQGKPCEAAGTPAAVDRLLSEAADLLRDSRPLTEEEDAAEREALRHICRARQDLARQREPEKMSENERELWDARAEEEAWGKAIELLEPMREIARQFGSPELTRVLEKAEAEREHNRALDVLEPLFAQRGERT
jgi:hypothetical protein